MITTPMPGKDAAAPSHVCPGMRIHAIDIVQPPGIAISPIVDMDAHQTIVPVVLAAKSSAETQKKAHSEVRSETMRASMMREMARSKLLAGDVASVMIAMLSFQRRIHLLSTSILSVPAYPLHREFEALLLAALGHVVQVFVSAAQLL